LAAGWKVICIFFSYGLAFQIKMRYIVIEEKKMKKNRFYPGRYLFKKYNYGSFS